MGVHIPGHSMLRLVCLMALAALCSAGGLGGYKEAVMKEYAHYKMQEGCFGKENVKMYKMKMMKASKKCSVEVPHDSNEMDFQEIINEIRSAALRYRGQDSDSAGQLYRLVPANRFRRDAHDPAQMLAHLKEKMTYKIANVSCMLEELKYKNKDNTPNYEYVESELNKVNDAYLRNQLHYGFDMCKDFANCMPVKKAKSPIMKELGTCISFFKCMEMKRLEACFMKDFREAMADYGMDAVEEKINMGLEMMGEEVYREGMDGYNTLEMAMMGNMF